MTTHSEAFEKWWVSHGGYLHGDFKHLLAIAWQAAKADSEREIAELKERLNEVAADWQVKHYQIEALKADNVIMRDALNKIALGYVNDADIIESAGDCLQRLSAIPAQEPVISNEQYQDLLYEYCKLKVDNKRLREALEYMDSQNVTARAMIKVKQALASTESKEQWEADLAAEYSDPNT